MKALIDERAAAERTGVLPGDGGFDPRLVLKAVAALLKKANPDDLRALADARKRDQQTSSLWQKSSQAGNAGETACATRWNQQLAGLVGQTFSLPGLLPRAASVLAA